VKLAAVLLFAFGCLIAALAAFLPATLVDRRLAAASNNKLRLANASGTLWNGRGNITDAGGTWRVPVGWSISTQAVARGIHEVVLRPIDSAPSRKRSASGSPSASTYKAGLAEVGAVSRKSSAAGSPSPGTHSAKPPPPRLPARG